MEQYIIAEG